MRIRRGIALAVVMALLLSLCGCKVGPNGGWIVSYDALDIPLPLPSALQSNPYQNITVSGDTLFLAEYLTGFTPGTVIRGALWAYRDGKRAKVLDMRELGADSSIDELFVSGSVLYFVSSDSFFAFNLETKTTQLLFESDKPVWNWRITDDYVAYMSYKEGYEEELYLYDRHTEQTVLLAESVESYGFVGDVLRYAIDHAEYSEYVFYEYDLTTGSAKELFAIEGEGYLYAKHTEDLIVTEDHSVSQDIVTTELHVYTLDGEETVYTLPENVSCNCLVLTQRYAYVRGVIEEYDGDIYHRTYTIHRVDLQTGACEELLKSEQEMNGSLYVVSDDCLYYECEYFTLIGQYVRQLYRFDIADNRHTKLMEY